MSAEQMAQRRQQALLGAMVVRAGLGDADRAFLLGGLIKLAKLFPGAPEYEQLRNIGIEEFNASARSTDRSVR
ncbi:conjugal transfer protein TraD [Rhizobium lusitanum]|nr:conjugal transfer protein TraD [Rhizobium sp. RCAM05973]MBM7045728.1 conjugal transfer protein TraD [Rhizobium lusitanum]